MHASVLIIKMAHFLKWHQSTRRWPVTCSCCYATKITACYSVPVQSAASECIFPILFSLRMSLFKRYKYWTKSTSFKEKHSIMNFDLKQKIGQIDWLINCFSGGKNYSIVSWIISNDIIALEMLEMSLS